MRNLLKPFVFSLSISVLPLLVFYLLQHRFSLAYTWGLSPMHFNQWQGILLMPLVHDNQAHLWGNTMQLFLGFFLVFVHFRNLAHVVWPCLWIGAGIILFWVGDRGSIHIGSSGLVYGLFSFLIIAGFNAGNRRLRLLSFMLLMYYGTMIWGLFPWQEKMSWEGHLSGATAGLLMAYLLRSRYRLFTKDQKPSWYIESDNRSDPYEPFDKRP